MKLKRAADDNDQLSQKQESSDLDSPDLNEQIKLSDENEGLPLTLNSTCSYREIPLIPPVLCDKWMRGKRQARRVPCSTQDRNSIRLL